MKHSSKWVLQSWLCRTHWSLIFLAARSSEQLLVISSWLHCEDACWPFKPFLQTGWLATHNFRNRSQTCILHEKKIRVSWNLYIACNEFSAWTITTSQPIFPPPLSFMFVVTRPVNLFFCETSCCFIRSSFYCPAQPLFWQLKLSLVMLLHIISLACWLIHYTGLKVHS